LPLIGLVGYVMLGASVVDISHDLYKFVTTALGATSDADFEEAGSRFAEGISKAARDAGIAAATIGTAAALRNLSKAKKAAKVGHDGKIEVFPDAEGPTAGAAPRVGETTSTATGKNVHKAIADARRASGEYDLVQSSITDKSGKPILVSKRVDLKTGKPQPGSPLQEAVPDAVSFKQKLIVDDKPLGRPIAKDRQEIIRFIKAYEQREGHLPKVIGISRYDPKTGKHVLTELYSPKDFLP
jgi:hypothetical protein